jgi:hypothetical protein
MPEAAGRGEGEAISQMMLQRMMAQNGHAVVTRRCPLLGVKPTWRIYEDTP